MCGQTGGGALERVQIFILAEGLKIDFFGALSGRESSLVQTFCESCVHLDITHPSVHMTQRFVIQGCPTLKHILSLSLSLTLSMLTLKFALTLNFVTLVSLLPVVSAANHSH